MAMTSLSILQAPVLGAGGCDFADGRERHLAIRTRHIVVRHHAQLCAADADGQYIARFELPEPFVNAQAAVAYVKDDDVGVSLFGINLQTGDAGDASR